METIRAFIAIEMPAAIQKGLGETIARLSPHTRAVHWVPPENIHLTLKFLGDIPSSSLGLLQKGLQAEMLQHAPCKLVVAELGAFPNLRRPRVIWIGIQAPPELSALQQGLENATNRLGFAREERLFSPHLTLGRVNHRVTPDEVTHLGSLLSQAGVVQLGGMKVESVSLFRSELKPGGAEYTRLSQARLKV